MAGRGPDGTWKPGMPLDWSHTAAPLEPVSCQASCFFFILVNLRPAICLCQEAGAKHVSGWVSSGASPRPCSGWAGPPAAGRSGSWECPVAGSSWHHVRSCQGGLLQGQYGKPQLGDQEGGQQKDGMGKGRDGRRVKPNFYSRHRAQGCISKGGRGQSREA